MQPTTATFHAARSTYVVAAFLCVVPVAVGLLAMATRPREPSSRGMAALAVAYSTAILLWVHKFRIKIGDGTINYQSLFGGTREVRVTDIESANIEVGMRKYTDRFRPPIRLVLGMRGSMGASREVTINLKVFALSDIATLMEVVERRDEAG